MFAASVLKRFWGKVTRTDGCWWWTAGVRGDGYGAFDVHGKQFGAHRFAWLAERGDIPDGMCVCHSCDHPLCVRPDHLWLGTTSENSHDMAVKGRAAGFAAGEDHPNSSLTLGDVREIRSRVASGEVQRTIAKEFGVSPATVCSIVAGKSWKEG